MQIMYAITNVQTNYLDVNINALDSVLSMARRATAFDGMKHIALHQQKSAMNTASPSLTYSY